MTTKSSKEQQGGHGDLSFLHLLHRAKSGFTGSRWGCRHGGDYISPSPRVRRQKKKEKAREKGENGKILEDPKFIKASQAKNDDHHRLSLESLSLEDRRFQGNSRRKGKDSSPAQVKINGQLEPKSPLDQDNFNPRGEKLGNLETGTASAHIGFKKSDKGKEKADTELYSSHSVRDALQDKHHEIVEVGYKTEASSSMHGAPQQDSRPEDLDLSRNTKLDTKAVNGGKQGEFENFYRRPADFQSSAFSPNSEIEEVGEVSNTLKSNSGTLRDEEHRKAGEEKLHHSVGDVAFSPNSEIEEVGEVANTSNSDSGTIRDEEHRTAEEEKPHHDSVDDVPEEKIQYGIDGLESPRDEYTESEEGSATSKESKNIVIPKLHSRYNLQEAEGEDVKVTEQNESPVSVLSGALGSKRWAGFDSAHNSPHTHDDDHPAVFNQKGEGENRTEPLKQSINDTTEPSSENLTEECLNDEMDPLVQTGEQKVDLNRADTVESREDPSSDHEREAQNSEKLQRVEGEKLQDGLDEKRIPDGGLKEPHNHHGDSPKTEGLGELFYGNGDSKTAANGVHQDGTHDTYSDDKGVAGSPKLYGITAPEKDDRASIYGAGEDRTSHLYADHSDYTGLQENALGGAAHLAHAEEPPAWKVGFFSFPHVLAVGALTVITVLGKAVSK